MSDFSIVLVDIQGNKAINFSNKSKNFVEVVFTINGKEVKDGEMFNEQTKGYCYPPKLEKPVKKMKDGSPLLFDPNGGEVVAYIFAGEGRYKDEDLDKPTFCRHELVERVVFKRMDDRPIETIRIKY